MDDCPPTLADTVAAMQRPLSYAQRNDFSNIDRMRGIEHVLPGLARTAARLCSDPETTTALVSLAESFQRFPHLSRAEQRTLVQQAIARLEAIPGSSGVPEPQQAEPALPRSVSGHDPPMAAAETAELLHRPVTSLRGVGPRTAELLARMGLHRVEDLLYCLPREYIDKRHRTPIGSLTPDTHATFTGTISRVNRRLVHGRRRFLLDMLIRDSSGQVTAKWFNLGNPQCRAMCERFTPGARVLVSGLVGSFRLNLEVRHPDLQLLGDGTRNSPPPGIEPVYPLTEGLQQTTMRKIIAGLFDAIPHALHDFLPEHLRNTCNLCGLDEALRTLHCPPPGAPIEALRNCTSAWHHRVVFDDFLLPQLVLARRRQGRRTEQGLPLQASTDQLERLRAGLPFSLTGAQQRALDEILTDLGSPHPMNRLMQGDVGCGKTVVAFLAAAVVVANGYQAAFMAPTEILAGQHFRTISELARSSGITVALLTGTQSRPQREECLAAVREGRAGIVVGTHALIQQSVTFQNLALAIIDEQHKFGVLQRGNLKRKGAAPHTLVMTATPIPRTLGLTVYGDLDMTIVDELPPGRSPVETAVYNENSRANVYDIVREALRAGRQVFIVYPLVDESETLDLRHATGMSQHLQQDIFPDWTIGLVHGRMAPSEKKRVMTAFRDGTVQILVATTVIEVGIDVPTASLMIVEHAERFGLSQLHQLRGRVGRGAAAARCILLAGGNLSKDAARRMQVMAETSDGFKIAEADFSIRGPGEFLGTRQAGMPDFRVAHLIRDRRVLIDARQAAVRLVEEDPDLSRPEHRYLRAVLTERTRAGDNLAGIG